MPAQIAVAESDDMESMPVTCRQIAAACEGPLPFGLDLRLVDVRVAVRSNCPELVAALARHYRDFPGDGGQADIVVSIVDGPSPVHDLPFIQRPQADGDAKEDYCDLADGRVVRKCRTGLWLVFGRPGHCIIGPCRENVDQVINGINARFMDRLHQAGARLFHAAGVAVGTVGLAIAGLAGAGKTTLTLEIMRRGAAFISNDRLLIGPGGDGLVMTGVPRMPRVNPGTVMHNDRLTALLSDDERAAYARLDPQALWRLERKYSVDINRCFGPGRVRLRTCLRAVVVLGWRPGGGAMRSAWVDIGHRPDLLGAFMKDLGVFFDCGPRPAEASDYLPLLGDCPVLEIGGGVDFRRAADLCLGLLGMPAASSSAPSGSDHAGA
jgi:HprK-related kinase B